MTVPSPHHRAGFVLRCLLVLMAVAMSSLCLAGQSAAESGRTASAAVTADARPAAEPLVGPAPAERDSTDIRETATLHEADGPASSDIGHCGKEAARDIAVAHDDSRPSPPLPMPDREDRRAPAVPVSRGTAAGLPGAAAPAPDVVQLSVLRI
ncbi:hypothetical protein [Streptomyces sp. enrichment culture]|uniref:hypothetical protein n=1 Tax=Streptomyces sp. enrichment culture TaxID=1795815 RepID=UPI003F55AE1D